MTVGGLVARPSRLGLEELITLGREELVMDVHCVTSWSRPETRFTGIPLARLVEPLPAARFASFSSHSPRGHHTSLPVDFAMDACWVVHEHEGQPLSTEHGGPVRVVTPGRYFYKSIKWLQGVELLAEDRLGWWETNSSYHNNADPQSGRERFTTGSIRPEQVARFLEASSYEKYRGRVMIGLDLTRWRPRLPDLRRLYLKNCDLSGVDLAGADLRESNLSLSVLRGASLAGADLSGSDLEGADFTGADLTGADLSDTALSAARFDDARLTGATFDRCRGLLESQERNLESAGVDF